MRSRLSKLGIVLAVILTIAFAGAASAQAQITLSSPTSPSLGTPGVTSVNVTGSGFPSGTISPSSVKVTLTPAGGGTAVQTTASAVTTIIGSTRRVTFLVPSSISVSTTTAYLVSISGTTAAGTAFSSSNSATLNIAPSQSSPTLTSIAVTPANPSAAAGTTVQFTATGTYSDGSTKNLTGSVTWASSSTATATINASGLASALKTGTTTISATSGSVVGSTTLTVTAPTLTSIAVTPANPSVAAGKTQQFTATGTFSDGSTQNLTSSVTWASSSTTTATISTGGLASALKLGTSTISATSGAITGSTTLTVTAATLTSIAVTPTNPSTAAGTSLQFTATGTFSDGTTQNLTSSVTWASSSTTTATINASGLASALKIGTTTISAASGAITGSTTLTVTAATLTSIAVTPTNPSTAAGTTVQFTATGTFSDGTTQNLTSSVTWASSSTTTATINASGLASALKAGTTAISAASGAVSGSTTLTVTAATLTSIAVTPANPSTAAGTSLQFTATGTFSDGTTQNLTSSVTWASSSTATATINAGGLASALKVGTTTISATSGAVTGSTTLTVTAATLTSIAVTPANPSTAAGTSLQFTATGTFSDGTTQNLTSSVTWASSSSTTATISVSGLASALKVGTSTISATSGAITGSTTLTVTAATLTSIGVTPVNASTAAGTSLQFTATGTFSDGTTQNLTSSVTWSSSSTTTATISATGLASALKIGTTTISATGGAVSGSTTLTVTAAMLTSIAVTPANPSTTAGTSLQFTATGTFSDGTTQNLTSSVTWASSSTATATINASGLASALKTGTTTISATSGAITGSTTLTVTAATLTSIAVTPANPSTAAGTSLQFTATGTFSDGTTQNLTSTVTWASSSTTTATISAGGLASALKVGTATISATSGAITGSTTLTVTAATLTSIAVTPASPSTTAGTTLQFTATGTFSDGTTQNLTSSATWASSSTATATISPSGLASALKVGTTTVSATSGAITGSTTLTVTAATLTSIAVTPASPSTAAGTALQFTATGTFSDGTTQNLTSSVTWASSSTATATISAGGLASALKVGTTTISATSGAVSGSTTLTVTAATLTSIAVTPVNPSTAAGTTLQFTATGTFSDGTTQNLTSSVTWASSSTATATINASGLASALKIGTTTISATSGAITGSTTLTVTAATLTSIAVTPANPSTAAGTSLQFTATGTFSDGTTQNLTSTVTWTSSSTTTATINASGLASALKIGTTTISATSGAITGSTTLTVTAATLKSIAVTPANPSTAAGTTLQFTATGTFSDGTTQNLTSSVTWASSSTATATINTSGLASALKVGTTAISATSGAITASTTLTVTAATLTSIAVTPVNPSTTAGTTLQFTATGTFSDGTTQNLTSSVTWASSSTATATINTSGLASALKIGTTTISATSGAVTGSTTLTVTAATLTSIAVTPANPSTAAGTSLQFTATGTFSDGTTQNLTSSVTWASSSTATATISTGGLASALKVGTATISATSGAITGSTTLTVTAATLTSIAVTPANPSTAAGTTLQFTATGTFSDGTTQNLTASVTWASSSTATATISATGLASALKIGTTTISATSGAITGSTTLTVTAATLTSIAVTPVNPSTAAGTTLQFTATGTFSDGTTQNLTNSVTWSSSSTATATINASGLASALKVGSTTITATSGAIFGNTTLTVTSATLVSIAVTPVNPSAALGTSLQFAATGTYSDGSTQNLTNTATWASSSTATATINATGLATAVKLGTTTISATSGAISGSTTLTVTPTPLQITTTSLPNGQLGVAYSSNVSVTGGTTPYTWAVTGGAFPSGVAINTSTGAITGTPTSSGTFTVTIGVNDSGAPVQTQSASYTFTIVAAATITSASPSSGNQADASDNITLTGQFTHFVQGQTTVSFGSSDVTVNSVTVNSSTSLTVNISIAANALIGARTVTATTNTEVATGSNVFTVLAGLPTVTLNPNFGVQGTNPTISITGSFTHFTQGQTTANFGSSDIAAGAVTVNSPTNATVQLQISVGAALGARTITINTGTESAPGTFTITKGVPAIVSLSPNVGGQNSTISVVVNGNFTGWTNGTSQANFGSGIAVGGGAAGAYGPVTVTSPTQLTASIAIASGATLGPRTVSVQTGAELETAMGAFTVENCTTTAAVVLYRSPVVNATDIPLNTQVQWEFNAPLDRSTINNTTAVFLYDNTTGAHVPVAVNLDPSGRIVTMTPSQLLAVGRTYTAYLGYGSTVKDACENNVLDAFSFIATFNPVTSGPSVIQTSPAANATNVPLNTQVVLQFSTPVDPLTLQTGITVATGGTTVLGTFAPLIAGGTPDYTRIAFTPGTALAVSTVYTATYTAQLTDVVGNPLQNPGSFSFTTGTASTATGGVVTLTDPTPSETNVGVNVNPIFHFSEPLDPISLTLSNVLIVDNNTGKMVPLTFTVSADRMSLTMQPLSPLQPGTVYYAYVFTYLDQAGLAMQNYLFYFTTAGAAISSGPTVTVSSPVNAATGAPVNTKVVAVMSGALDPGSVGNNAITVKVHGTSTLVSGAVTLAADQVTLTWTPAANLSTSTQYDVAVSGVTDVQGNASTPFNSTFTTSSNGAAVIQGALVVTSVVPVNGATGQSNSTQIVLTFSEAVNPETVPNILVRDQSNSYYSLAGTWSVNGAVATFTPAQPYPANATIQIYTQCLVHDYAGTTDNCFVSTFTVGSTADTTHPTVTSITPSNGATGIGRNTIIVLTFSKSLNPVTVTSGNLAVFNGDVQLGGGPQVSGNGQTVTYNAGTLPASSVITVNVSPNVTDLSGNSVVSNGGATQGFESSFTTAADLSITAPYVATIRPASGATDVPANAVITMFIHGLPLNPSTVNSNTVHVSHNGVLIDGTINLTGNNQAIEFAPSQNFNNGDLVQVFLSSSITDVDATPLTAFNAQFTIQGNPGTTAPQVLATNPFSGSTTVATNPIVQVEFDQAMQASTINSTNVYLYDGSTAAHVPGTLTLTGPNNNIVQFVPSSTLSPSTSYYFYLINVTNASGFALSSSYYLYFQTGANTDATPPTVVQVSPLNGTTNVGVNAFILVQFSKPVDTVSVNGTTVQVTGASQTVVPYSISFDTTRTFAYVTPQAPLPASTLMTIKINGVTDVSGNAVTPSTTTFTTGAGPDLASANVIYFNPDNASVGVPTNTAIVVQYDKPMDTATICDTPCGNTYLYDTVTGVHVAGTTTFSTDLKSFTFVPSAPLAVDRTYTIYAYSALDLTGNVQTFANASFTTSYVTSSTVPAVVLSNPANTVTSVPVNVISQVMFNEAIRPETITNVQLLQGSTPVPVTQTLSNGSTVVSLTPQALLLPNTVYTISVSGVQDVAGHTQTVAFTSTFTTGPTFDVTPGPVAATDPVANQIGVGTNTQFRLFFSKRANPISLQVATYHLIEAATNTPTSVSFTSLSADGLTAVFSAGTALLPNTQYYFQWSQLSDVTGNAIYSSYFYFTTGAGAITTGPAIVSVSPTNGTTGTPVNTQVVAVASATVDPNTVSSTSFTVKQGATVVPGTVTLASDLVTMTWVPSANLNTSTTYTVNISGIQDSEGNLITAFTSTFTTGSSSTAVGPGSLSVSSVSPVNGAVGQSNSVPVVLTFSEAINRATINNVLIRDASNGYDPLAGSWVVNGNVATFTAAQAYPANAQIQIYTQCAVRDFAGNTDNCFSSVFTIGATTDTTPFTVVAVSPAANTTNVGTDVRVAVTFSKSINQSTLTTSSLGLLLGNTVTGTGATISADGRTATFNTSHLAGATTYTVVATSSIQDLSGNALQYFQSQFTTVPSTSSTGPSVVTQRPAYGATGVAANTVITLFTNGAPLNPSTVSTNSVRVSQNGTLVPGTATTSGNNQTIVFTPASSFAPGVIVQIYVDPTIITDVNSVPLNSAYSGQFTIAPVVTGTAPTSVDTNPQSGGIGVPLNVLPQVKFNQPLLASTVNSTNVTLLDGTTSTNVSGAVSLVGANNDTVQFQPSAPLTASTYYYLYINGVTSTGGVAIPNSYYVYFQTGTASDSTNPLVSSVGPANGVTSVGTNAAIVLTFSKAIDAISVTGATVKVTGGSQTVVPTNIAFGRYSVVSPFFDYVQITPEAPLPANTTMTIAINGITDLEGHAVTPQTTTFTTGAGPDLTAPTVIYSSYLSGDIVPTNAAFTVEFDRAMDPGTLNSTTFYLYDSSVGNESSLETVTVSSDSKRATLTVPNGTLVSGHTISINSYYAQDTAGNAQNNFAIAATVGASADTTPPVVLETNPPASLTGVPLNVPIQIEFNKEISEASIGGVQLLLGSTPVAVAPSFTRGAKVLTLTPVEPLQPSTAYTISITGVTDITGNVFSGTQTQTFTTGTGIKLAVPVNVSVTPCCSQTGVSDTTTIQLVFDSPMDPLTFDTAVGAARLTLTSTGVTVSTTVSFSPDFKTVTLTPSANLTSGTSYTVVVSYGSGGATYVTDMAGNSYAAGISTAFTAQ